MTFLVVLIAYLFQQKLDLSFSRQLDSWVYRHKKGIAQLKLTDAGALGFLVFIYFIVIVLVMGIFLTIEKLFWGAIAMPLEVVLMLLCIGQNGYRRALENYVGHWSKQNFKAAGDVFFAQTGEISQGHATPCQLHKEVYQSVLYHHFNRFFLVFFWFVILGPTGVIVVRLNDYIQQYSTGALQRLSLQMQKVLEWLPARFLIITFALVGDFTSVLATLKAHLIESETSAKILVSKGASAALKSLDLDPELSSTLTHEKMLEQGAVSLNAVRSLLSRSMVVWLGVLAIVSMLSA